MMGKIGSRFCGAGVPSGVGMFCDGVRSLCLVAGLGLVTLVGLFFAAAGTAVAADRPFSLRFNANINGEMQIIGNTLMSCSVANHANCTAARGSILESQESDHTATVHLNDNDYTIFNVNDADTSKTNASSSRLSGVPAGASVVWAGLYWGAETATSAPSSMTAQIKFPGSTIYQTITSTTVDSVTCSSPCDARYGAIYVFRSDELGQIQNGDYTVANISTVSGQKTNSYGGWGLVVVYQHSSIPLNNIAVYDGYKAVCGTSSGAACSDAVNPLSITVNGFVTPLNGPVISSLGVIAYEGDRETFAPTINHCDDAFTLDGIALSQLGIRRVDVVPPTVANCNPTSPTETRINNFFNSNLTNKFGRLSAGQVPNYQNQLGFDIASVTASLTNSQTSATFSASSTGDRYYPDVLVFTTNFTCRSLRRTSQRRRSI